MVLVDPIAGPLWSRFRTKP